MKTFYSTAAKPFADADILIFKTNIKLKKDALKVQPILQGMQNILRYNIDQGDIDNVLRLEVVNIPAITIVQLISQAGFYCEELTD
jgi:uncharacterized pyridoxamine 5'-phosphate oxidase family protein